MRRPPEEYNLVWYIATIKHMVQTPVFPCDLQHVDFMHIRQG